MAQIRLYWTPFAHGYDVLGSPLVTLMDLSILTWLKRSKPMHSMPLSMPLFWTESLDHLEHVMGPYWCLWVVHITLGGGFSFSIVLVLRNRWSLCHAPIKPDLLGFPGIGVFACGLRDHVITRFSSCGIRAWHYWSSYILLKFSFLVVFAKFLSVECLLLLGFAAYEKNKKKNYFILLLSKIYQ
jgi:hypothetical protein